jgi:hypothetical protein
VKFKRITVNPEICTGKPCIRDLRFPVSRVLGLLAAGEEAVRKLNFSRKILIFLRIKFSKKVSKRCFRTAS